MIDPSLKCYIPSFVETAPLVPEKIFEFFPYRGRGGHLDHVAIVPPTHEFDYDWPSSFGEKDV